MWRTRFKKDRPLIRLGAAKADALFEKVRGAFKVAAVKRHHSVSEVSVCDRPTRLALGVFN